MRTGNVCGVWGRRREGRGEEVRGGGGGRRVEGERERGRD